RALSGADDRGGPPARHRPLDALPQIEGTGPGSRPGDRSRGCVAAPRCGAVTEIGYFGTTANWGASTLDRPGCPLPQASTTGISREIEMNPGKPFRTVSCGLF